MSLTKEVIARNAKNDESQHSSMNMIEVLKIMKIKPDDFVSALVNFIESKSFGTVAV